MPSRNSQKSKGKKKVVASLKSKIAAARLLSEANEQYGSLLRKQDRAWNDVVGAWGLCESFDSESIPHQEHFLRIYTFQFLALAVLRRLEVISPDVYASYYIMQNMKQIIQSRFEESYRLFRSLREWMRKQGLLVVLVGEGTQTMDEYEATTQGAIEKHAKTRLKETPGEYYNTIRSWDLVQRVSCYTMWINTHHVLLALIGGEEQLPQFSCGREFYTHCWDVVIHWHVVFELEYGQDSSQHVHALKCDDLNKKLFNIENKLGPIKARLAELEARTTHTNSSIRSSHGTVSQLGLPLERTDEAAVHEPEIIVADGKEQESRGSNNGATKKKNTKTSNVVLRDASNDSVIPSVDTENDDKDLSQTFKELQMARNKHRLFLNSQNCLRMELEVFDGTSLKSKIEIVLEETQKELFQKATEMVNETPSNAQEMKKPLKEATVSASDGLPVKAPHDYLNHHQEHWLASHIDICGLCDRSIAMVFLVNKHISFCKECRCHVCSMCDCSRFHISNQDELLKSLEVGDKNPKSTTKKKKKKQRHKKTIPSCQKPIEGPAFDTCAVPYPDEDLVGFLLQTGSILALASFIDEQELKGTDLTSYKQKNFPSLRVFNRGVK